MTAVRALLPRTLALLAMVMVAAGAPQHTPSRPLVLLCNTTGPCRPCKSLHGRASAACALNVYERGMRCEVADADDDLGDHDVRVEPQQGRKYKLGEHVDEYAPCEVEGSGVWKFEAALAATLAAALAVIRRRRAAWS